MKTKKINNLVIRPKDTELQLIFDNRSGERLEIVIPVFNEEKRIINILNYYKGFDVVLLDGGSVDRTIDIASEQKATVYSRVGAGIGENHFVYYNNVIPSGFCCLVYFIFIMIILFKMYGFIPFSV